MMWRLYSDLKEADRTGKKLIEIVEECLVEYNKNQNELLIYH